jgi:hypothetical protein
MSFNQDPEISFERAKHNLAITVACMVTERTDSMPLDEFPQYVVVKKGSEDAAGYSAKKAIERMETPEGQVYEIFQII